MDFVKIDPSAPDEGTLKTAASVLNRGGVIIFPTETFYGVLARIDRPAALRRVQALKGRDQNKPMPCIAGDTQTAKDAFDPPPPDFDLCAGRFWPGPLTIVGHAKLDLIGPATGGGKTIGVRVPGTEAARRLAEICGTLLAATSANPSGKPSASSPSDIRDYFSGESDIVFFDGGPLAESRGSTIVDFYADPPNIVREGDVATEALESLLGRKLTHIPVREDEKLQELLQGPLRILQKNAGFRYTIDALLLASFVKFQMGERILDIGSGTGVIPLLLAAKGASRVYGIEIQPELVDMSRRSIAVNRFEARASIVQGDARRVQMYFEPRCFDLIISNPPYFPVGTGHMSPDDARAASRHELTLSLSELLAATQFLLKENGRLCLIHLATREKEILLHLEKGGLYPCKMQRVYPKEGDDAKFILVCAVKGERHELEIYKPLILHTPAGEYTDEVKRLISV